MDQQPTTVADLQSSGLSKKETMSIETKPLTPWQERLAFVKSRLFWKVLCLGQVLSLCITGCNVVNTKIGNDYGLNIPTTQTFLVYVFLALIFNTYGLYKRGFRGWLLQFWRRGIPYFFLAFIDVEGNYLVVKSYQYTSLLSAMLLDCWSTPVCMILSVIFLKVRYRWVQYLGVVIALVGLALLVVSDLVTDKNYDAIDPIKGDLFCLLGATFYGFSNVGMEYMSRKHPIYEVLGVFGTFGAIINLVQLVILERSEVSNLFAQPEAVGMVMVYIICSVVLYCLAPVLFRWSSALVYNMSILTSDFYGLIFGLGLFGYKVTALYPVAYVIVIVGIFIYYVFPAPIPSIGTFDAETEEREKRELMGWPSLDVEASPTKDTDTIKTAESVHVMTQPVSIAEKS
ncbi:hypothetical protein BDF14DRAFT_1749671 [Spinellus fusiger]|nr:hypothetical protein BDF14DRAFT_1749671 [Spinellus fusiger]